MVLLEVEEIAVGDYSQDYGTVTVATDEGTSVYLKFINGTELTPTKGTQMYVDQGDKGYSDNM